MGLSDSVREMVLRCPLLLSMDAPGTVVRAGLLAKMPNGEGIDVFLAQSGDVVTLSDLGGALDYERAAGNVDGEDDEVLLAREFGHAVRWWSCDCVGGQIVCRVVVRSDADLLDAVLRYVQARAAARTVAEGR